MSNYPPPGMSPTAYQPAPPPPPQPSGCGCGGCLGKFFILLGVCVFLLFAACCGTGYFGYQSLNNSIKRQPNEVQAIGDEITSMHVPAELQAQLGGHVKVFSFDLGTGVVYNVASGKSFMVLASPSSRDMPTNAQSPLIQVLMWLESRQHPDVARDFVEQLSGAKTNTIERTIRGEPGRFDISEGTSAATGAKKIRVQGTFQGKTGPANLFIIADKDVLSREKVDEIIQSIGDGAKNEKK